MFERFNLTNDRGQLRLRELERMADRIGQASRSYVDGGDFVESSSGRVLNVPQAGTDTYVTLTAVRVYLGIAVQIEAAHLSPGQQTIDIPNADSGILGAYDWLATVAVGDKVFFSDGSGSEEVTVEDVNLFLSNITVTLVNGYSNSPHPIVFGQRNFSWSKPANLDYIMVEMTGGGGAGGKFGGGSIAPGGGGGGGGYSRKRWAAAWLRDTETFTVGTSSMGDGVHFAGFSEFPNNTPLVGSTNAAGGGFDGADGKWESGVKNGIAPGGNGGAGSGGDYASYGGNGAIGLYVDVGGSVLVPFNSIGSGGSSVLAGGSSAQSGSNSGNGISNGGGGGAGDGEYGGNGVVIIYEYTVVTP